MKNNYFLCLLLLTVTSSLFAQKFKVSKEDEPTQQSLKFETPITVKNAIIEFSKVYGLSKENTFVGQKINTDIVGNEHQRHQQFFKGIKVEFGTIITHSQNGQVSSVNGELYNPGTLSIIPSKTAESCFEKALYYSPSSKYVWEDSVESEAMDYKKPSGELILLPLVNVGEIKLAYKFDIFSSNPIFRDEVYVDANTGALLYKNPIIKHADRLVSKSESDKITKHVEEIVTGKKQNKIPSILSIGTAATRYSGNQNIETSQVGANFVLWDQTRGGGIHTYNSANTDILTTTDFTNSTNTWNSGNYASGSSTKDNAALDAHWGAIKTFDFWKNTFNRNSFDDNNGQIKSYVHFNPTSGSATGWDNANWNGSVMRYGDGNSFDVLTSIDVIGHEIGHAVCQYTASLAYQNQSGAMNEGYSDIWGACIEQYSLFGNLNAGQDTASPGTLAVWKIGEKLATNPLRSMSYPLSRNNPDTFKGTRYTTTADDGTCTPQGDPSRPGYNDYCGVHNNSGVFNHWFYILTAGKSGTNNASAANGGPDVYNVAGIGMTKSSQIAYYVERDYLTPNSKFTDARNASIAVASALYCASSPEVQAVTNAWFAVNVGNAYSVLANDVALKSISGGNTSVACGAAYNPTIVIENAGTNTIGAITITYNIDGGANSTINWTGNLANCSTTPQVINVSGLTRGYHTLNVTTTITGDGNATNNTKSLAIVVNNAGTVNVVNTFNAVTDALVSIDASGTTNDVWQRGTLAGKTNLTNALAGSQVYATRLTAANYNAGDHAYLVSQCYNLSNMANPTVNFDMAFDFETNYDFINFEYSTNSGATWNILGTSADANWYNSSRTKANSGATADCDSCPGAQWTGAFATGPTVAEGGTGVNGNKRNYSHSLSQFGFGGATPASNIIFRFNFFADGGVNAQGVFIDNFVVQGVLATNENHFDHFSVYPNPSKGKFTINLSTNENVTIQLFDMRGRSVHSKTYIAQGATFNQEVDLSFISSGVYILNVESNGKKEAKRIIIE